ncbi:MAG: MerR family transcriptional regulator [Bacilli bacterium]|nr:MerR family transcriptional regulator [Bacilli bacterium]
MLYKIGDFSKEVNVPVKTLRYYDEINLFKPIEVDLYTGYRYYSDEQIDDLKLILMLKEVGFSLEEIKQNWDNFTNDVMLLKRKQLLKQADIIQDNIRKIDYLRSNIVNNKIILNKKINIEPVKVKRRG